MSEGFGSIVRKLPGINLMVCQKIAAEIFIVHRYGNTGDNSFIAVDDFASIEDMAKYLISISQDKERYKR